MITNLKQLFNESASQLKKLNKLVNQVNQLEEKYESFSDEQLRDMTPIFREKLQNGMKLDDLKIEAFAVVREAAKRVSTQPFFNDSFWFIKSLEIFIFRICGKM